MVTSVHVTIQILDNIASRIHVVSSLIVRTRYIKPYLKYKLLHEMKV